MKNQNCVKGKNLYILLFMLWSMTFGLSANAQPMADSINTAVSPQVEQLIYSRLKASRPELTFSDLTTSPIKDIYKVKINGQLAFVSSDGGHIIAGEMYQVLEGDLVNLQEQERQAAEIAFAPQRAKMMASVSKDDMVIFKPKGKTKGYVNVFTDIDCGFCRRLHSQIDDFLDKGIEIRYLAFPRAGVSSKSAQKLVTVWCGKKPQDIMTRYKKGENLDLATCDNNPIADQYMLGQQIGVSGTPSIILESGQLIPGAVSADFLAKEMGI